MSKPRVSPKELADEIKDVRINLYREPCIVEDLALDLRDSRAAVAELVVGMERVMDGLATNLIGLDPDVVLDAEALIAKHKIDGGADE